jgi:hypothetical protein
MYAESIDVGIRQVLRWIMAAQQDEHPGIKLLHSNYAVGNLDMLAQQFSPDEIIRVTGYNPHDLHKVAIALQDEAMEEATVMCPHLRPSLTLGQTNQEKTPNILRVPVFWMGVFASALGTVLIISARGIFNNHR